MCCDGWKVSAHSLGLVIRPYCDNVLAAAADFERDLIVERTLAGQARARAADKHMGPPPKADKKQHRTIRLRLAAGETVNCHSHGVRLQVSRAKLRMQTTKSSASTWRHLSRCIDIFTTR